MAKQSDDDPYQYAALQLQQGRTVDEVRKQLTAEQGVPADEARTMVLNVYAAQMLQEGRKESEVRKRLLAEKNVTPEEATTIITALRAVSEEDAPAKSNPLLGWGVLCVLLGVGSFILPLMGVQFKLLALFGEATPFIGVGLAVVGAILVILALSSGGSQQQ